MKARAIASLPPPHCSTLLQEGRRQDDKQAEARLKEPSFEFPQHRESLLGTGTTAEAMSRPKGLGKTQGLPAKRPASAKPSKSRSGDMTRSLSTEVSCICTQLACQFRFVPIRLLVVSPMQLRPTCQDYCRLFQEVPGDAKMTLPTCLGRSETGCPAPWTS